MNQLDVFEREMIWSLSELIVKHACRKCFLLWNKLSSVQFKNSSFTHEINIFVLFLIYRVK